MVAIENIFVKYINLREKLNEAKIYKIVDRTNDSVYIGSTCDSLKNRLSRHNKRYLKGLLNNIKSFDIIKNNNYKIELLENCDIKTKEELLERERVFIKNNECLNKVIPGRSNKEWKDDNKDKVKQNSIDYREANKDKINEKFNCICGGQYTYKHKATHQNTTKHLDFLQSLK